MANAWDDKVAGLHEYSINADNVGATQRAIDRAPREPDLLAWLIGPKVNGVPVRGQRAKVIVSVIAVVGFLLVKWATYG